jgi:hypothetical protein
VIKTIVKEPNKANETWLNYFSKIIVRNPIKIITGLGSGLAPIYFLKNSYSLPKDVASFCKKFIHIDGVVYIAQQTFVVAMGQIYRSPLEPKVPFSIYCVSRRLDIPLFFLTELLETKQVYISLNTCVSTHDIYARLRNIGRLQEKLD